MRLIVLIFAGLFIQISVFAQETEIRTKRPGVIVKVVPTALANVTNSALQAGVEYKLNERFTLSHEFGWIITNPENTDYIWRRGMRHLSEARFYIKPYEYPGGNFFFGLQFRYWGFRAVDEENFCRQDCLFRQNFRYEIERTAIGSNLSFGFQQDLWSDRLIVEAGFGFGFIKVKNVSDLPEDADLRQFDFFDFDFIDNDDRWRDYERNKPNLLVNIRLGYILK